MQNWRDDVKKALMQAGVDNKQTSFLFVDTQIINEQMLEDINNILNSGDVPNLYKIEDYEPIFKVGKLVCMEKNIQVTKMNMFSGYIARVKKNIHMIIAMSPLGEIFRSRIRKFPSLVNCCTIDRFLPWPKEALQSVAEYFLNPSKIDLDNREGIIKICVDMQERVSQLTQKYYQELKRFYYVTPTSYLVLIKTFQGLLGTKRN